VGGRHLGHQVYYEPALNGVGTLVFESVLRIGSPAARSYFASSEENWRPISDILVSFELFVVNIYPAISINLTFHQR